jgi:hypothetical protein
MPHSAFYWVQNMSDGRKWAVNLLSRLVVSLITTFTMRIQDQHWSADRQLGNAQENSPFREIINTPIDCERVEVNTANVDG